MKMNKISFTRVIKNKKEHIDILFNLLNLRKYRISSVKKITLFEHRRFVKSNPYRSWYIIYLNEKNLIGTVYVTKNNMIGINLIKNINSENIFTIINFIKKHHRPLKEIKSVRSGSFGINTAKSNHHLQRCLKDLGYKISQISFNL